MTAVSSAKTGGLFYKFFPYYRNKLKLLRPQMIMMGIFALLSYPFAGLMFNLEIDAEIKYEQLLFSGHDNYVIELQRIQGQIGVFRSLSIMSAIIGIICLIGMFIFTFVSTHRAFRRLYNKTAVDMDYALPVTGNTRFFSDIASIFTACILPHLVSILIGLPFAYSIASKMHVLHPTFPVENINSFLSFTVQGMFAGLISCVMLIGLSLLVMSCCGKRAEAAILPIMINFAIPVIHAFAIIITNQNIYGCGINFGTANINNISATSPIGIGVEVLYKMIDLVFGYQSENGIENYTMPLFEICNLIPAILLTIAFFVGAYFLLKNRRNERVGNPYVYKAMGVVLPGIVILALSLPMWNMVFAPFSSNTYNYMDKNSILGWVIGLLISTFIVYVILELISGKAFKRFLFTMIKWLGTTLVCAGITAIFAFSNGFGASEYVPAANDVRKVSVELRYYEQYSMFGISDTDNEDIVKMITEIHKRVPKQKSDSDKNGMLYINYRLKNGEIVERRYQLTDEECNSYMNYLITPETWYESMVRNDVINEKYFDERANAVQLCSNENEVNLIPNDKSGYTLRNILNEVRKDAEGMNFDKFKQITISDTALVVFRYNNRSISVKLYPFMENTAKYLAEQFTAKLN